MKKSKKNFIIGLFFISGLFLANFFNIENAVAIFFLIIFIILALIFQKKKALFYFLIIIAIFLGILMLNSTKINPKDNSKIWFYNNEVLDFKNNKKITVIGKISAEPDKRIDHQKLEISAIEIKDGENKKISGKILAKTDLYPPYYYGDLVELNCALVQPGMVNEFNYAKYLSKDNIYSLCYGGYIKILDRNKGNFFINQIYKLKNFLFKKVNSIWPDPVSSFANSSLFGFEKLLPSDIDDDFRRTGLSHIVVVSGMHVAIIIVTFSKILYQIKINRKQSFVLLLILLTVFAILSGLSSSIIRASIMGILVILSKNIGRYISNYLVILYSVIIMTFINPLSIFYDIGFQLSFLATIGLIYLSPIIIKYLKFIPETFALREIVSTSVSAIIMTLPISLYNFHRIPIFSLLSNIAILPFIMFDMTLYVIAIVISLISTTLAQYFGFASYILTKFLFWVIKTISNIKISVIDFSNFTIIHMIIAYILIILIFYYAKKKSA